VLPIRFKIIFKIQLIIQSCLTIWQKKYNQTSFIKSGEIMEDNELLHVRLEKIAALKAAGVDLYQ
jgi:hypothetical protein